MMRVSEKGQITIPVEIRERFGFLPHTEVEFVIKGDTVTLVRSAKNGGRGGDVVRRLRGSATVRLSTDEILKLTRT